MVNDVGDDFNRHRRPRSGGDGQWRRSPRLASVVVRLVVRPGRRRCVPSARTPRPPSEPPLRRLGRAAVFTGPTSSISRSVALELKRLFLNLVLGCRDLASLLLLLTWLHPSFLCPSLRSRWN